MTLTTYCTSIGISPTVCPTQNNFVAGTAPFLSLQVKQKSRFFKELGIRSPKLDEPRLRPFETWFQEFQATASDAELENLRKLRFEAEDFGFAVYEPWSDKQFPHIRRYLDEHDPLLEKASDLLLRRPNAYVPYWQIRGLQEGKELNFDFDSLFYSNRDFKHDFFYFSYTDLKDAFRAESNSLLAKGRLIDARDEAFKIFRLSHSLSSTATLIESTSPCGYHNSAIHQISRIIKHPNVDLKFLEDLQEQLENPTFISDLKNELYGEQIIALATIQSVFREQLPELKPLSRLILRTFDPQVTMATLNRKFSKLNALFGENHKPHVILERLERIRHRTEDEYGTLEWQQFVLQSMTKGRVSRSRLFGELALLHFGMDHNICNTYSFHLASLAQYKLCQIAIELEHHKKTHGEYPEQLEQLISIRFEQIPSDPFSGKEFHYRKHNNSYLLYSVGRNQVDDGGGRGNNDTDLRESDDVQLPTSPPRSWAQYLIEKDR